MKRLTLVIAIGTAVLFSARAPADSGKGQSLSAKRQMAAQVIDCMKRRMSTDQRISYNEASRLCKEEVSRRLETAESGPLVAADGSAK